VTDQLVLPDASVSHVDASPVSTTSARRRWRRSPLFWFAVLWLIFLGVCALVPSLIATHDPLKQDLHQAYLRAGSGHLLGTDRFGRDLFSRAVWGSRSALQAILIATGLAFGLGVPSGMFAAWRGGRVDRLATWFVDVLFALPLVLLALAMVGVVGTGLTPAMIVLGVLLAARVYRVTRAAVLAEREELYVDAGRITGLPGRALLARYVFPNILPTLIVQVAVMSAGVLLVSSLFSFLGVGASADSYDWGAMLNQARFNFLIEWWPIIPPSIAIVSTVIALNLIGDGLVEIYGRDSSTNSLSVSDRSRAAPASSPPNREAVLSIREMSIEFAMNGESRSVVSDVSLDVFRGEMLAVVGESGSGKTMTVMSALGLTPHPGRMTAGSVWLNGRDVTAISEREWQKIRGRQVGVIFQEPGRALNPVLTVGTQLMEPLRMHQGLTKRQARTRAGELLSLMGVPDPQRRIDEYPYQFSGGMAQRVGVAIALACGPDLLIADEPTSALDVTLQGQLLDVLDEIRRSEGMAVLLITHDLGVVAEIADRVAVMYAGQVVEVGTVHDVLVAPEHPYTSALIATAPHSRSRESVAIGRARLPVIPGTIPAPSARSSGCRFQPRCVYAIDACSADTPPLIAREAGRAARCIRVDELSSELRATVQ
jgi:peptide/nickel transport system permease protein